MRTLSQEEWGEIMGRFITKLGHAAQAAYQELHTGSPDSAVALPVRAEPFAAMLCDGVLGFLSSLNALNEQEAKDIPGVDKFDIIELYAQEMFSRLTALGYTTAIEENTNPDAYEKASEAIDEANKPPKGTSKH